MLRTIALMLAVAWCGGAAAGTGAAVGTGVAAETVVPLAIGDAQVRFALPDGYVRLADKAAPLFEVSAAALPPSIRLVDVFVAEDDLKRMLTGNEMLHPYLQVQAMRSAEALDFSAEDWRTLQPGMARQLGALDMDAASQGAQQGMGERMGEAAGVGVELKFGAIGKPMVYAQDGGVVRYVMRLPVSGTVNGQAVQMTVECAGAVLVLDAKLLMINAYLRQDAPDDNFTAVRAFLDAAVARAQALNPPPATAQAL